MDSDQVSFILTLVLNLLAGLLLSWSVGLLPALIYRYGIYKAPIEKKKVVWRLAPPVIILMFAFKLTAASLSGEPPKGNPLPWIIIYYIGKWIMTRNPKQKKAAVVSFKGEEKKPIAIQEGAATVEKATDNHSGSYSEEELYTRAAQEVETKKVSPGIMAKAIAEADGDDKKAVARYIKYRVTQLGQEITQNIARQKEEAEARQRETDRKRADEIKNGIYTCPNCGCRGILSKKARGNDYNVLVCALLFFAFVIPGILYWLAYRGYKGLCPYCGVTVVQRLPNDAEVTTQAGPENRVQWRSADESRRRPESQQSRTIREEARKTYGALYVTLTTIYGAKLDPCQSENVSQYLARVEKFKKDYERCRGRIGKANTVEVNRAEEERQRADRQREEERLRAEEESERAMVETIARQLEADQQRAEKERQLAEERRWMRPPSA